MRIARFDGPSGPQLAVVQEPNVQPLDAIVGLPDLLGRAPADRDAMALAACDGAAIASSEVRLMAPLEPTTLRDFMTFEEHVEGVLRLSGREVPDEWRDSPQFYFSNPNAIVGPDDPVEMPPGCTMLDFELEVAAIIGREGRDLTPRQAREHIAGYTILNDWSARDLQVGEMAVGLGPAKAKDFATTLGPWIVTADELEPHRRGDRLDLDMRATVNGVEVGNDTLANMAWSFEEMVAYASRGTRILPGDVLGSGTCGAGCLAELWGRGGSFDPPPLKAGDTVTLTVTGLGTVTNEIVPGAAPTAISRARHAARRPRPWDEGRR